jgi:hypothetical protein
MSSDRDIREAVEHLADTNKQDKIFLFDAEVLSVDADNRICSCVSTSGKTSNQLDNVRLMSSVDDGLLFIPAVGSTVTIILSTFTLPLIIQYSEIEKVIFRGGDLFGMVKVKELTDKLNAVEDFAKGLQTKLNDLVSKYNSHTHILTLSSGTGTAAPTTTSETPDTDTLNNTQQSDIENTNITQG